MRWAFWTQLSSCKKNRKLRGLETWPFKPFPPPLAKHRLTITSLQLIIQSLSCMLPLCFIHKVICCKPPDRSLQTTANTVTRRISLYMPPGALRVWCSMYVTLMSNTLFLCSGEGYTMFFYVLFHKPRPLVTHNFMLAIRMTPELLFNRVTNYLHDLGKRSLLSCNKIALDG